MIRSVRAGVGRGRVKLRRQGRRPIRVWTESAPDVVLLKRLTGSEGISQPFLYEVELLSDVRGLDPGALIGQRMTVEIDLPGGGTRFVNGYVWACRREPDVGRTMRFRATLVPWLRLLEQSSDCRIFQGLSAPEIIKTVFRNHGFSEFRDELCGEYSDRDYCVQYRESALHFVSRLMEDEGISYRFDHLSDRHELVLMDDTTACVHAAGVESLPYVESDTYNDLAERVWDWSQVSRLRPRKFSHTDFDYENPSKELLTLARAPWEPSAATFEVFDYPGGYANQVPGERYSSVRIEQAHSDQQTFWGRMSARGLEVGRLIRLDRDPFEVGKYVVTRAEIDISMDEYESSSPGKEPEPVVLGAFEAVDATRRFRPGLVTPRPIVQGPQTAIVVGPEDQEIYTDKQGRVKVQFHWDRYGVRNQNSSCWIRVSQAWGGKGFGGVTVPRIGQEVIVDFLEGNPDRPIITGRVYNGANRSSLNLPGDAMKTCLRTNSLKNTGGYNEIVMDDTPGKEGVHIRSQYDHTYWVGHDRIGEVGNDSIEKVGNDLSLEVGNNASESVGVDKVVDVGNTLVIKAGTSITLKCGASTIHMNQAGFITISGTVINIAGAVNCNMVAPITSVTGGLVSMNTGGVANIIASGGPTAMLAGGAHTITSGAKASVGAPEVAINGGSQVAIDGGSLASIVGGSVKIN